MPPTYRQPLQPEAARNSLYWKREREILTKLRMSFEISAMGQSLECAALARSRCASLRRSILEISSLVIQAVVKKLGP